jgi:transposase
LRCVNAVVEGMTQTEAARTFGVCRQSVNRWAVAHAQGGARALRAKKRGRRPGQGAKLLPWQAAVTARLIQDRCPDQLKLPFVLWTREAVAALIAHKWGVRFSLMHVGRCLKRWGFTPQKPVRRAYEREAPAVARWLQTEYPAIAQRAKAEGAEIHWGDEMGLRSDHQAGTSYGRKGQTPVVAGTGQRFRCNMISTVTNLGTLRFMVFTERFTAPVFIEFLRRLLRAARRKVYLILDSHPVHRSRQVRNWLAARAANLEVFFLPPYSPELNPDELLNQDVKANAVGRRRAKNPADLAANVRGYLRSTQKSPQIVKNYFREVHVCYAA